MSSRAERTLYLVFVALMCWCFQSPWCLLLLVLWVVMWW